MIQETYKTIKQFNALKMIVSSALFLFFLQKHYSVDHEPPVHPCVKDGKCLKGKGQCVVSVCVMNKDRQMYGSLRVWPQCYGEG